MKVSVGKIRMRVEELHEFNPMMGLRGCRLGIVHPEITEMQARAIFEAALDARAKGAAVKVEIMVPLVGTVREFNAQAAVIRGIAAQVLAERGEQLDFMLGTMIETPRAALIADSIGKQAEFFSFGTNDLTQMTLGFSRDDAGKFLPDYLKQGMYEHDPFRSIDQKGVGHAGPDGGAEGPLGAAGHRGRRLRRTRRRPGLGGVLPSRRARLRELLAVPRADRPSGGGAGSHRRLTGAVRRPGCACCGLASIMSTQRRSRWHF